MCRKRGARATVSLALSGTAQIIACANSIRADKTRRCFEPKSTTGKHVPYTRSMAHDELFSDDEESHSDGGDIVVLSSESGSDEDEIDSTDNSEEDDEDCVDGDLVLDATNGDGASGSDEEHDTGETKRKMSTSNAQTVYTKKQKCDLASIVPENHKLTAELSVPTSRIISYARETYVVEAASIISLGEPICFSSSKDMSCFIKTKSPKHGIWLNIDAANVTIIEFEGVAYFYYSCYVEPGPNASEYTQMATLHDKHRLRHMTRAVATFTRLRLLRNEEKVKKCVTKTAEVLKRNAESIPMLCNNAFQLVKTWAYPGIPQVDPKRANWTCCVNAKPMTAYVEPPKIPRHQAVSEEPNVAAVSRASANAFGFGFPCKSLQQGSVPVVTAPAVVPAVVPAIAPLADPPNNSRADSPPNPTTVIPVPLASGSILPPPNTHCATSLSNQDINCYSADVALGSVGIHKLIRIGITDAKKTTVRVIDDGENSSVLVTMYK